MQWLKMKENTRERDYRMRQFLRQEDNRFDRRFFVSIVM